jgi:HicB family
MGKGGRSYRFNLRVSPDWMTRVRAAAEQLGISMADFIIMVVNERLGAAPQPTRGRSVKGKKHKEK